MVISIQRVLYHLLRFQRILFIQDKKGDFMWDKDKKKKVLVINGSPKLNRSTTMSITNAFIEGLN